jgi:hypothetical protein
MAQKWRLRSEAVRAFACVRRPEDVFANNDRMLRNCYRTVAVMKRRRDGFAAHRHARRRRKDSDKV